MNRVTIGDDFSKRYGPRGIHGCERGVRTIGFDAYTCVPVSTTQSHHDGVACRNEQQGHYKATYPPDWRSPLS